MILATILVVCLGIIGVSVFLSESASQMRAFDTIDETVLAYTPHDAIWIQSNQEMIDQADDESWSGDGSVETPYIISGYSFNQDTQPLRIWNTDLHWIFTGNLVDSDGEDMQCGTWIDNASNGLISGNIFRNRHSGLVFMSVENVNVTDNVIYSNTATGMDFLNTMTNCEVSGNEIYHCSIGGINIPQGAINSTITGNHIYDCGGVGISIAGVTLNCLIQDNTVDRAGSNGMTISLATNSIVSLNTVTNASNDGIQLYGFNMCQAKNNNITQAGGDGLVVSYADESIISLNSIIDCSGIGIDVASSSNITISWNCVEGNVGYAIQLSDSTEYMEVVCNTFVENCDSCQIYDDGVDNVIQLNYYSDWNSPDNDANGIVDNPYLFDGEAENSDPYPLAVLGVIPDIEDPSATPTTPTDPDTIPMNFIVLGIGGASMIVIIMGVLILKRR